MFTTATDFQSLRSKRHVEEILLAERKEDVRVQTLQHPCLPVGDIIRLYHDVALDKKMVNKFIRRNALLQVAVDKLFHLYFKSKHGVGDDSYFEDGEHWW